MAKLYTLRLHYSLNGRNVNDSRTTNFLFRSDLLRGAAGFTQLATNLANALREIMTNQTVLLRAVITETRAKNQAPVPRNQQTTVPLDVVGLRVSATNSNVALQEVVALLTKKAAFGNPGGQSIRGCFFTDEVRSSEGGNLQIVPGVDVTDFTAFAGLLAGIFTAAACPLVLNGPKNEDFVLGARPVNGITFSGVGLLQRNNHRASLAEEEDGIIRRTINAIEREYDRAARGENGVVNAVVGAVLFALQGRVLELIARYTLPRILRFALPPGVNAIIRALPA